MFRRNSIDKNWINKDTIRKNVKFYGNCDYSLLK